MMAKFSDEDIIRILWFIAISTTSLLAIGVTIFSVSREMTDVFPHLYYIPIILASVWYPRRGLLLIGLVIGVSLGMVLFGLVNGTFNPVLLLYPAIYVWVVATISFFLVGQWRTLSRLIPTRMVRDARDGVPGEALPLPAGSPAKAPAEDVDSLLSTLGIQDD